MGFFHILPPCKLFLDILPYFSPYSCDYVLIVHFTTITMIIREHKFIDNNAVQHAELRSWK